MTIGALGMLAAAIVACANQNYVLADGETLDLTVNGGSGVGDDAFGPSGGHMGATIRVEFKTAQFVNIAAATAAEVVAVINAAAAAQAVAGQPASILASVSATHVQLATVGKGDQATLEVMDTGTANTALGLTPGITTGTGDTGAGSQPSAPVFMDVMSFTGDSSYTTGGTVAFEAKVQAFFKDGRKILAIIGQDCGGYVPVYMPGTKALKVYKSAGSAIALAEVANAADLSATTFNVLVISQ